MGWDDLRLGCRWPGLGIGCADHRLGWPLVDLAMVSSCQGLCCVYAGLPWAGLLTVWDDHVVGWPWSGQAMGLFGHGLSQFLLATG
jgi:hypothetical protein